MKGRGCAPGSLGHWRSEVSLRIVPRPEFELRHQNLPRPPIGFQENGIDGFSLALLGNPVQSAGKEYDIVHWMLPTLGSVGPRVSRESQRLFARAATR
jgi:hypothetical protein